MTRTPTAEEVLALHMKFREAANKWVESDDEDGSLLNAHMAAAEKWERAYQQYQAAQGPVTREWFEERFGGFISEWELFGICWVQGEVYLGVKRRGEYVYNRVPNPTRSKIEALVEMLGGAV